MITKAEKDWYSMNSRCSERYKEVRKSYKNCSVDERFKDKQYFVEWWDKQPFAGALDHNEKSYHLDKDILVPGNCVYSPETCVFVPAPVNSFYSFLDNKLNPFIGAIKNKTNDKWAAYIKLWPNNCVVCLGMTFKDQMCAHLAYCAAKDSRAKFLASYFQGEIDGKVIHALNNFSTREQIEAYAKHRL